jgi:hypothetical protein
MIESEAMLEIRRIRDANSLRHLKMTPEELSKEMDDSMRWFVAKMAEMGKTVDIVRNTKH